MKLAISNIAWPPEASLEILKMVKELGCEGIELAPSRIWEEPLNATRQERKHFLETVRKFGLSVVALHSLLYSREDLGLFRGKEVEKKTIEYIKGLILLTADLGAELLVFGSPRNRRRGGIPLDEAFSRAAQFFLEPASLAADIDVCIVIEPLSPQETDFITSASEGMHLVNMINHPGFGLQLDAKALAEESGNVRDIIVETLPRLKHFHVNDPGLVEVGSIACYHKEFGAALYAAGYSKYVSIEMKTLPDFRQAIARSIIVARKYYISRDNVQ